MFRNLINTTPFTSEVANSIFEDRIYGYHYNGDTTFVATLRAVLDSRLGDGESVRLVFNTTNYGTRHIRDNSVAPMLRAMIQCDIDIPGTFYINNFGASSSAEENNSACTKFVKEHFIEQHPGWVYVEKATVFFRKIFAVTCFINPETKSVVVFTEAMDTRKMHYLQIGIPALMPWYFGEVHPVTEEETELFKSLREKTSEQYEACLAKFAEKYDFETLKVKTLLAGFEHRYERRRRDELRSQVENIMEQINNYQRRIGEFLRQKAYFDTTLFGLELKLQGDSDDSEIMDYFLSNKSVSLVSVDQDSMLFIAKGYVTYFDEEQARSVIDNRNSSVYMPDGRRCNNYINEEDMKKLMEAIFIDQTLKMRFCAAYKFQLDGEVAAQANYAFGGEYSTYMPNPHIQRYRCLGTYGKAINECLKTRNYIGAIEQCVASVKSLNFGDSIVMGQFIGTIYGLSGYDWNNRCIELPDGSVVRPKDAVAYLNRQTDGAASEEA